MIQSAPFYWLVCDDCGKRADYDEYTAWDTETDAYEMAYGWTRDGLEHYCPACEPQMTVVEVL